MSLRYALLGLLAGEPASGYDLTQRFERQLGMIWPAKHPQIYGELSKLSEAGLIEIESEGPRGRKVYRITDSGREEVRRWLTDEPVEHRLRAEPLLRSLFFWLMRPDDLQEYLDREAVYYREMTAIAQSLAAAKDRGDYGDSPQTKSMRVMLEAGMPRHHGRIIAHRLGPARDVAAPGQGQSFEISERHELPPGCPEGRRARDA
jgi:DNA-binding PadR family transcriptional regulator